MSKTSCLAVHATVQGDGVEISYRPPQSPEQNANAPEGGPSSYALAIGQNALPVPSGSLRAMIIPSPTATFSKQLMTTSSDVGISFVNEFQVISLSGVATLYITASAVETLSIMWL